MKELIEKLQEKHDAFIGNRKDKVTSAKAEGFKEGLVWAIETAKTLTLNIQAEKEYNKRKKDTMENQARHIWKKNLKGYNDIMRLDSIILKSMVEFAEEYHEEQKTIEEHGTVNWIE